MLVKYEDIRLTLVHCHCKNLAEFSIVSQEGYTEILFPDTSEPLDYKRYYRNVWRLLQTTVNTRNPILFQMNYHYEYPLLQIIRKDLPYSHFCFVVHYQQWCFRLKGNTALYKSILHKDVNELTSKDNVILKEYKIEREMYENVNEIICMSKFTQRILIDEYGQDPNKVKLIYNGVTDKYTTLTKAQRVKIRKELLFEEDEKIILFVGRLSSEKGIDYLIDAFKYVLEKIKSRLVIVGSGNVTECHKKSFGFWNKITYTGQLDQNTLYRFYQVADVGVMPSFHEQCSYVALEMMMMNVPMLISDSTGLHEIISERLPRIKVHPDSQGMFVSSESLATQIMAKLEMKRRIGHRHQYMQCYTDRIMEEKYHSYYLSVLNNSKL